MYAVVYWRMVGSSSRTVPNTSRMIFSCQGKQLEGLAVELALGVPEALDEVGSPAALSSHRTHPASPPFEQLFHGIVRLIAVAASASWR